MTRKTTALSGASQDAYFRRVLMTCADVPDDAREAIVHRLRREISQLRVRAVAQDVEAGMAASTLADASTQPVVPTPNATPDTTTSPLAPIAADVSAFDPYALNVVVTLRTNGRDAALEALSAIANSDHLKLLAREQRLSIDDNLGSSAELCAAIVHAAERRLANRRAAASIR